VRCWVRAIQLLRNPLVAGAALLALQSGTNGMSMVAPQNGTLVVMIPTSEGLVVSADTRHTMFGVTCDSDTKLYFPKNSDRTVVTVTGTANFLAVKLPFVSDPCEEIARSPVLLSVPKIVLAYLEEKDATAETLSLAELAQRCMARTQGLLEFPPMRERYIGGEIYHVVVASYDADKRETAIRSFTMNLPTATQMKADQHTVANYRMSDVPDWRAYGQGQYMVDNVLNGVGRKFVGSDYDEFLKAKTVSEVTVELAARVTRNLVEATSKTSELLPITTGVGGAIHTYLIDGKSAPKEMK
jgi:hypothetical protein